MGMSQFVLESSLEKYAKQMKRRERCVDFAAETLYYIFHADPPSPARAHPPATSNVVSVTLRIRASDLGTRHQRLVTDQVHAKKSGVQQPDRLTHLHRSSFHVCLLAERHVASVLFKSANMMA